jgi:hypothetical protein
VPVVVRTLLRTVDNSNSGRLAIAEICKQAVTLSSPSLALLVDVLNDGLTLSTLAPSLFIKHFQNKVKCSINEKSNHHHHHNDSGESASALTHFDVIVIMILFRHPQHSFQVHVYIEFP